MSIFRDENNAARGHYRQTLISRVSSVANSNSTLFEYTPALNYSGTDEVVVSAVEKGGKGNQCGHQDGGDDQYTFKIMIKVSSN